MQKASMKTMLID
jgi:hypothetical protein